MANEFEINVSWKDKNYFFPAKVIFMGYIYKIEVTIFETKLIFDKDEDREWRAIISPDSLSMNTKIDVGMIQAIMEELNKLYS